ncbi:type VI secretion system Vgr family protein, partial [Pseudomonas sp. URMO17WK12:I11]|uniref:type VI secretion system Vgr family protein n=1 Tax=Pseudomonas sp. URMO17WK12:I11 TaxID=1283291 RepID=UPI0011A01867
MAKSLPGSTHNHYTLEIDELDGVEVDVLSFNGEEWLSQPFKYTVAFTSSTQDIDAAKVLGKDASFQMGSSGQALLTAIAAGASRTLHGMITGFKRLSSSKDEARYEVTLQPRLALLSRGKQYRIYQHQSVPEIVESILRSRHQFEGQHFLFDLLRDYPKREQVMQYGESDLAFISRLLAEVGIWYCFTHNDRLSIDVV